MQWRLATVYLCEYLEDTPPFETASYLVEAGASVNAMDRDGKTAYSPPGQQASGGTELLTLGGAWSR